MRAFDRLPAEYRGQLLTASREMPPKNALEILQAMQRRAGGHKVAIPQARHLSPQNRRVRFAVDTDNARAKVFPNFISRQQLRREARTGQRTVTHNPEEVAD
jgi:hypothetical protein